MATPTAAPEITALKLAPVEQQVLIALIAGLYAEPGFSDVEAADLAKTTGLPVRSVVGAIGSLVKKGIVNTERYDRIADAGRKVSEFIHLNENHYNLHPEWRPTPAPAAAPTPVVAPTPIALSPDESKAIRAAKKTTERAVEALQAAISETEGVPGIRALLLLQLSAAVKIASAVATVERDAAESRDFWAQKERDAAGPIAGVATEAEVGRAWSCESCGNYRTERGPASKLHDGCK